MGKKIKALPALPSTSPLFPVVVRELDRIRFELEDEDENSEFYWFAREYPRCYRYHLDHAEHRLNNIFKKYTRAYEYFELKLSEAGDTTFEIAYSAKEIVEIYWDFEAFLSSLSSALDILARIIGLAYEKQTPVSFNKLCAKKNLDGPVEILRQAKTRWVSRLKDYRDCFVHYTPVDTVLSIKLRRYSDGWEVRCKLPANPNIRDILGFRYSRRIELLKYSITVFKHMVALDKKVGVCLRDLHRAGLYPKQRKYLFFVGKRTRR